MRKKYVILAAMVCLCLLAVWAFIPRMPEGMRYAWQGNVAFLERDGRIGLVNRWGEMLLEPMLTQAGLFDQNGLAAVAFPGGCGLLNRQGDFVHHAPGYEWVQFYSEEYGVYQVCGRSGDYYLDAKGQPTGEPDWQTGSAPVEVLPENTRRLKNGYLLVKQDGLYRIQGEDGTLVKELPWYARIEESRVWNEEEAWLMAYGPQEEQWRVLTLDGEIKAIPEMPCEPMSAVIGGMVRVAMEDALGFMDLTGRIHSDPAWTATGDFMGGMGTADIGEQTLVFIGTDGQERFRLRGLWRAYLSWAVQVEGNWYYRVISSDPLDGSMLGTWVNEQGELLCPAA